MDHQQYIQSLRRAPNSPNYEILARSYKNALGIDELIFLHRVTWDYVDWLEANTENSFADWVVHTDKNPSEGFTLSHLLSYWLWFDECNRFRQGMPTPCDYPPLGYEGWADEYHESGKN